MTWKACCDACGLEVVGRYAGDDEWLFPHDGWKAFNFSDAQVHACSAECMDMIKEHALLDTPTSAFPLIRKKQ